MLVRKHLIKDRNNENPLTNMVKKVCYRSLILVITYSCETKKLIKHLETHRIKRDDRYNNEIEADLDERTDKDKKYHTSD